MPDAMTGNSGNPGESTGWALQQAYRAVAREFTRIFAAQRLSPVQFGVLAHLAAVPGLTQSELAKRVLVRPQSIGEVVVALIERDLLIRASPRGRGRRTPLRLTSRGTTALTQVAPAVRACNRPAALGLTTGEVVELNFLLRRMADAGAGSR
ncbi:MarR family winged helix-turn-helix transcriptional regulator [Amycolatopsis sp. QT-25]|uniref:MarR family winged helix-turn-helix transcriptional regulator n=1 Tax=Amycolatopsis sp. QT-25 TaxID=3034022 RepID=UPI0023ED3157|nr:MarR family winged helix-turn-helix transcriptional regulator [Amycolatopsis sp. QT-25]WET76795.1 MarR family winged helix-turn-helix transcriptional regulator [Amycolatopsis sp. QT-25]